MPYKNAKMSYPKSAKTKAVQKPPVKKSKSKAKAKFLGK